MVFHTPYPLQENPVAASALRPKKMREAFEDEGFDVIEVTGYAKQRRRAIKSLLDRTERGLKVEFVYSESATIPNSFTERRHLPLHLRLDRCFFRQMKNSGIPVGVFYRDVYWVFPEYVRTVGRIVAAPMRALYKWDLDTYARYLSKIFVPAMPYWEYVRDQQPRLPFGRAASSVTSHAPQVVELPPAADFVGLPVNDWEFGETLEIFYVGGIDNHLYDLSTLIDVVGQRDSVALTLCVPKESWNRFKSTAKGDLPRNVKVVHARGVQLEPYYMQAHICAIYMPPEEYRDFAVPVKMYEYLAHSRPVFATQGSLAAAFLEEWGVGWSVPFGKEDLMGFLDSLEQNPGMITQKARAARAFGEQNSWKQRAMEAAEALGYSN